MQREDPAHRSGFAFCFRISSSTPWPIEMKIRTVHVPRPSPCTVLLGPCSRWTAEEEMRKKRDLYRTEISVEGPNLAGLQHDGEASGKREGPFGVLWARSTLRVSGRAA